MNLRPNVNPDVLRKGVLFILAEWGKTEYWLKLATHRELLFKPDIYRPSDSDEDKHTARVWRGSVD